MGRKTKADPTGQARNRQRSTRRLQSRVSVAQREVKALFRSIPKSSIKKTRIQNAQQTVVYDYEIDIAELERTVEMIINAQLLETQTDVMPFDWYWKEDVERPYREATAEEVRDFNVLIAQAVVAGATLPLLVSPDGMPVEQVLLSQHYRQALNAAQTDNFRVIRNLSRRTSAQVMKVISDGIQAGDTPTSISNQITERFDVAKSSAKRIAETEVNKAYNDAQLNAADALETETGLRSAVMHISALLPTTRATHAARHGNVYTVADQLQWWNSGTNRINCKCTTRTVLIDRSGKVVDTELQQEIKAERSFFDA